MDFENRMEKLQFHQRILLEMAEENKYSFYKIIIKNDLSEIEMNEIIDICYYLNKKYEEQYENGFVHYTSLLVQFVGTLPTRLDPKETILALKNQQYFPELMEVLLNVITKEKDLN
jgi:hypothetical protein